MGDVGCEREERETPTGAERKPGFKSKKDTSAHRKGKSSGTALHTVTGIWKIQCTVIQIRVVITWTCGRLAWPNIVRVAVVNPVRLTGSCLWGGALALAIAVVAPHRAILLTGRVVTKLQAVVFLKLWLALFEYSAWLLGFCPPVYHKCFTLMSLKNDKLFGLIKYTLSNGNHI